MKPSSPLLLLCALGALSASSSRALAAVDTSEWKCEACPFEKTATSGSLDAGIGNVSGESAKFGDYTGLDKKGSYLIAGGSARYRNENGTYAKVEGSDLTLDARALSAEVGQDGSYALRVGYREIPHNLSDSGVSPFIGAGTGVQTLPAGFPVASTASIPNSALQPVDVGFKRSRLDASATWYAGEHWTHRISARRDVRDGTQLTSGSFFSSASQLVAPVNQVTDQIEFSTNYATSEWQASLAYVASRFQNDDPSLTWANPFNAVVTGARSGQLALAPDNQFQQLQATGSYRILPNLRASGDIAFGRMTQDAGFLAPTLNSSLAPGLSALPATSLDARVDTLNGNARVSFDATERLRINASYTRNTHDNHTQILSFPAVSTDMFLGAVPLTNLPYTIKQNRYKLNADYHGPDWLKTSLGIDEDERMRSQQTTETTREGTVWGRVALQTRDSLSIALRLAHADRKHSGDGTTWLSPGENVYMRKYNLADRKRDTATLRADYTPLEGISLGVHIDYSNDDYHRSAVGLTNARSTSYGADVAASLTETTQLHLYAETERLRSNQAGSANASTPDWWASNADVVDVLGIGIKQSALGGKLELSADWTFSRAKSDVTVYANPADAPFPTAKTSIDSLKLNLAYRVQDNLSLIGGLWHEDYRSHDWTLDGIQATTVANLLALGEQPPHYRITLLRLGVNYRF